MPRPRQRRAVRAAHGALASRDSSPCRMLGIGRAASSAWKHCSHAPTSAPAAWSIRRLRCLLSIGASATSCRNRSVARLIAARAPESILSGMPGRPPRGSRCRRAGVRWRGRPAAKFSASSRAALGVAAAAACRRAEGDARAARVPEARHQRSYNDAVSEDGGQRRSIRTGANRPRAREVDQRLHGEERADRDDEREPDRRRGAAARAPASRRAGHAATLQLRRGPHVHRAHDREVVVERDERRDDADDHEPGPAAVVRGREDVELADEAAAERQAGEAEHEEPHRDAEERPLPAEAGEVSSVTGAPSSRSRAATTANEPNAIAAVEDEVVHERPAAERAAGGERRSA